MGIAEQKQTYSRWLADYEKLIFKVVCAYAKESWDQNDLFQEIALQVWKSIPRFRGESAETTWVYRISLNTALSWSKKERNHQRRKQLLESASSLLKAPQPPDARLAWLYEQIHQLHPANRSLVLLFLDGYSYSEMADILGITESNVGVKINRIKKQLIIELKQETNL
ncbi:MAG: RNA polymerase sigma factor [Verrucomicrobiota bacterium]